MRASDLGCVRLMGRSRLLLSRLSRRRSPCDLTPLVSVLREEAQPRISAPT